jgi:hypothetical protein
LSGVGRCCNRLGVHAGEGWRRIREQR